MCDDVGPTVTRRLMGIFVEQTRERLVRIAAAVSNADPEALMTESHTLSSGAATFGATALSQIALDIELACHDGNLETAYSLAETLAEIAEPAFKVIERYIADD
jgi:HPt (histidine-containing phosphotransfer) domain-containing protein